jgi:hypothetical protein
METLTRELLLTPSLPLEEVPIPELGGSVFVRPMTMLERAQLEKMSRAGDDEFRARVAAICAVDAQGNRILSNDDAQALNAQNASVVMRIFEAGWNVSAISRKGVEAEKKGLRKTPD